MMFRYINSGKEVVDIVPLMLAWMSRTIRNGLNVSIDEIDILEIILLEYIIRAFTTKDHSLITTLCIKYSQSEEVDNIKAVLNKCNNKEDGIESLSDNLINVFGKVHRLGLTSEVLINLFQGTFFNPGARLFIASGIEIPYVSVSILYNVISNNLVYKKTKLAGIIIDEARNLELEEFKRSVEKELKTYLGEC